MIGVGLALGVAAGLGVLGLARSRAVIEPREPICADCKQPDCTGSMHYIGVHDKEARA